MNMALPTNGPSPRLWTRAGFRADDWARGQDAGALAGGARAMLPIAVFRDLDPSLRQAALPRIGVEVLPGEPIEPLVPHLDRLPLVALAFPAFNDGRSYSKAALLRTRHAYRGELRATGEVLIDQIAHMLRCGFTSFEIADPTALARLQAGHETGIPLHYQPAVAEAGGREAYAWRRRAVWAGPSKSSPGDQLN